MKNDVAARDSSGDQYLWASQDCPICRRTPSKFMGRRGGDAHRAGLGVEAQIWKCASCELVFPNPMPIPVGGLGQHYDIEADDYFSAHDESQRTDNAGTLLAKAESLLGRKGRLLDIGVGRGEILIAASKRGWYVEGVEPSSTFAEYVEARTQVRVWRQPVEAAEIAANSFDVVVLAAVLEHLYDPDGTIRRISEILVDGGLLYVDVPNEAGLYFKVGNFSQKLRGRNWCINLAPTFSPYHVFGFSPKALKKLLAKHGLETEVWRVYAGTSLLPAGKSIIGKAESLGSRLITALSGLGNMGTYIETWARKR